MKMKLCRYLGTVVLLFALFTACNDSGVGGNNPPETRSFYMGFTPWPYAATLDAQAAVYSFINSEGDLVAHHFQQGVPFTATDTLVFSTYHSAIQNEINDRIASTATDKQIYLAVDSLNAGRDDLTDLWASEPNMSRPSPWDARGFADTEVITAYTNFSIALIERFRTQFGKLPVYFNYGTEISDLMINNPTAYVDFYTHFAPAVYTALKATYPELDLMVSIALKSPGGSEMDTVKTGFTHIADYADVVGISTYGYAFYGHDDAGDPDSLPADWLTQIVDIAPGKSYGITETGWIAESLEIPAYSLSVSSSEAKQKRYLEKLFDEAHRLLDAQLVIFFTAYDYDTLWIDTLGQDDLSKIWKDTGLIDESFSERSALSTWRNWFLRIKN